MDFGLFSNGFRPHTTAAQTYEEDLYEIVLADELGFRDVWISEHHGEPVYIDKVDTLPSPELLMAKAAGQTKRIRMGPAVKLIHLYHPVDTAQLCAVTDHLLGGRYMFGFGSGFPQKLFSEERGLSYDDRYPRMLEALDLQELCGSLCGHPDGSQLELLKHLACRLLQFLACNCLDVRAERRRRASFTSKDELAFGERASQQFARLVPIMAQQAPFAAKELRHIRAAGLGLRGAQERSLRAHNLRQEVVETFIHASNPGDSRLPLQAPGRFGDQGHAPSVVAGAVA